MEQFGFKTFEYSINYFLLCELKAIQPGRCTCNAFSVFSTGTKKNTMKD